MIRKLCTAAPLAMALAFAATSCDSPTASRGGAPARLDVVSGDLQTAEVGTELPQALVVRVLDDRGKPVRGQAVNFVVTAGGGSVFAGTANTNDDGVAQERWTLGPVADSQRVEARAVDATSGQKQVFAVFRAIGRPGAPASIAAVSPTGSATGAAGAPLADSAAVLVKDRFGNPVPGVKVTWTPGEGTVSSDTSRTGPAGIARTRWTLGPELGEQLLTAAVAGPGTVTLAVTATPGAVASVEIVPASLAFDALGAEVPFQTRARDALGHEVGGVIVDLLSLEPAVVQLKPGPVAVAVANGTARIVATVRGTAITDTAQAVVLQRAATVEIEFPQSPEGGGGWNTAVGDSVRPRVRALDRLGNPIADPQVGWTTSNPAILAASPSGYLVGKAAGRAQATATVDDASATASVGVRIPFHAQSVWAGKDAVCAISPAGNLYCQGRFNSGSTGSWELYPVLAGTKFERAAVETFFRCALSVSGGAWCHGDNASGQVGSGSSSPVSEAAPIAGFTFTTIDVGDTHTCAIADTGVAYCWGRGAEGQLGNGGTANALSPSPVAGSDTLNLTQIHTAGNGTCGLSATGAAYCWGVAAGGAQVNVPTRVQPGRTFTRLAVGKTFVCGLDAGGAAWCWGTQTTGQLGNGSLTGSSAVAQPVAGGLTFTRIAAHTRHVCALTAAGDAYCWGSNGSAQLGLGVAGGSYATPRRVEGGYRFKSIDVGEYMSCGVGQNDVAYCWGWIPGRRELNFYSTVPLALEQP